MRTVIRHGRYYSCDPQDMGRYELRWLSNLWVEISKCSPYSRNHLINLTWMDTTIKHHDLEIYANQEDPKNCKIWFCGSVDGMASILHYDFVQIFIDKGFPVSIVGFSEEHWNSWYPYWIYKYNRDVDTTLSNDIKFLYLSYNRKPHQHRQKLVEEIIQNKLLDLGYVTFQHGIFPEVDISTGNTESDYNTNIMKIQAYNYKKGPDSRYSRPEDATSLGNLDIWNHSYLNIISETSKDDPYLITEKTYKPIIGLRPFIYNSHPNLYIILKKLGFYTTKDFFNDFTLEDGSIESIVRLISHLSLLSKIELYELYQKQLPMLIANKQRLEEICNSDRTKILNWSQAKK